MFGNLIHAYSTFWKKPIPLSLCSTSSPMYPTTFISQLLVLSLFLNPQSLHSAICVCTGVDPSTRTQQPLGQQSISNHQYIMPLWWGGTSGNSPPSRLVFWLAWFCASLVCSVTDAVNQLCSGLDVSDKYYFIVAAHYADSSTRMPEPWAEGIWYQCSTESRTLCHLLFYTCWLVLY